jgi:ABC-type nitrate/sulfonate/bicarbonate transport system substrate-binding protein
MSALKPNCTHWFVVGALLLAAVRIVVPSTARAADPAMRIAFPSGMNGQIVVTMEKAKIAEKNGLKAEFSSFQYGPPMMEALAAGSLDAIVTSILPVAAYAAKIPGDIKIVAIVNQGGHALMVAKDSPIATPAAFVGKKIGVSFGSDSHLDALIWLRENGLVGKATLINVPPGELTVALSNQSVDAIVIRQPQVLRLQQESGARILKSWPLQYIAVVKAKFMDQNPKQFQEYLASLRETAFFMAQNPDVSAKWFGEYLRMDPAVILQLAKDDPHTSAGTPAQIDLSVKPSDRAMIENRLAEAYAEKIIKEKVDPRLLLD